MQPTVLVTSAAGNTGFHVARFLLESNFPVKALVHRESQKSNILREQGANVVVGNMLDMRDLQRALSGVQRAYFCAPFSRNSLHFSMLFACAAKQCKLEHVVKTTQWLPHCSHPSDATRSHWVADKIFEDIRGLSVSTINPGLFAEFYFLVLGVICHAGMMPMPLGSGRNAPPSNEDMARVIVEMLKKPEEYSGRTLRPTGPELISASDIVEIFSELLGKNIRYWDVPMRMFTQAARAMGFPDYEIYQARYYMEEHQRGTFAINAPTNVVEEVTGREAEGFKVIAQRYLQERPEAKNTFFNKLKTVLFFNRMMLTLPLNFDKYARKMDLPHINDFQYSLESSEWRADRGAASQDESVEGAA